MFRITAKATMKVLVTDLDGCITVLKEGDISSNQFLSKHLISHVVSQSYDSFYICTHRCRASIANALSAQQKQITGIIARLKKARNTHTEAQLDADSVFQSCKIFEESDPYNVYTFRVVENFRNSINLPLHAVSTPDDDEDSCGSGYEKKLKPFENMLFQNQCTAKSKGSNFDIDPNAYEDEAFPHSLDPHSKNKQLLKIAQDIARKFPNTTITLDYLDDNLTICVSALLLLKHSEWPHNVTINIFQHDPFNDIEIKPIQSPQDINVARLITNHFKDYNISRSNLDNITEEIQFYLALIKHPYVDSKLLIKHILLISKFPFFSLLGGTKELVFEADKWLVALRGSNHEISPAKEPAHSPIYGSLTH